MGLTKEELETLDQLKNRLAELMERKEKLDKDNFKGQDNKRKKNLRESGIYLEEEIKEVISAIKRLNINAA